MSTGEQVSKHESEPILEGGDNGVPISWPRNGDQPSLTPSNYFVSVSSAPASTAQATLFPAPNQTRKALDTDHGQGQSRGLLDGLNRPTKESQSALYKTNSGLFGFQRQGTMDLHDTSGSFAHFVR